MDPPRVSCAQPRTSVGRPSDLTLDGSLSSSRQQSFVVEQHESDPDSAHSPTSQSSPSRMSRASDPDAPSPVRSSRAHGHSQQRPYSGSPALRQHSPPTRGQRDRPTTAPIGRRGLVVPDRMSTESMMPSLVHRPRLLDLHTRHMALVGKLTSDLEAAVLDTEWYAGLQSSVDVFSACGPMHERAGLTPTQRLTTIVPLVQQ
eukprot:827789-Prymnesium_polylepis.1